MPSFVGVAFPPQQDYLVKLTIHSAWNIPFSDQQLPSTFITIKTFKEDISKMQANFTTKIIKESHYPEWNQEFLIPYPEKERVIPTLILSIVESTSSKLIFKYRLPLFPNIFTTKRQLTLILQSPSRSTGPGLSLCISLTIFRKKSLDKGIQSEYDTRIVYVDGSVNNIDAGDISWKNDIMAIIRHVEDGNTWMERMAEYERRIEVSYFNFASLTFYWNFGRFLLLIYEKISQIFSSFFRPFPSFFV